ncbi:hypothetical protein MP228_000218 [Amoeboaphelidium protococcarum]|nr:hypothetical protein MP228_000218 [Amoeboaphelidium protococcarum]
MEFIKSMTLKRINSRKKSVSDAHAISQTEGATFFTLNLMQDSSEEEPLIQVSLNATKVLPAAANDDNPPATGLEDSHHNTGNINNNKIDVKSEIKQLAQLTREFAQQVLKDLKLVESQRKIVGELKPSVRIGGPSNFQHLAHINDDILKDLDNEILVDSKILSGQDKLSHEEYRLWRCTLLPQLEQLSIYPSFYQRRRELSKNKALQEQLLISAIPQQFRRQVWLLMVGNDLNITEELFNIFWRHARSTANRVQLRRHVESSGLQMSTPPTSRSSSTISYDGRSDGDKLGNEPNVEQNAVCQGKSKPVTIASRRSSISQFNMDDDNGGGDDNHGHQVEAMHRDGINDQADQTALEQQYQHYMQKQQQAMMSRSILGLESSVALIPVDLPRTVVDVRKRSVTLNAIKTKMNLLSAQMIDDKFQYLDRIAEVDNAGDLMFSCCSDYAGEEPATQSTSHQSSSSDKMKAALEAFVCYRPDYGYVQGMSYLASMITGTSPQDISSYETFVLLANMLHRPVLRDFYTMNNLLIKPYLDVHAQLLRLYCPQLSLHLQQFDISPEMYLIEWVLTVFAQVFPLEQAYKIWDTYVLNGDVFILQLSVAVLIMVKDTLINGDFERCATILTRSEVLQDLLVQQADVFQKLIQCSQSIKLTDKELIRLLHKCQQNQL